VSPLTAEKAGTYPALIEKAIAADWQWKENHFVVKKAAMP
jgi:hypothetical protein